MPAYNQTVNVLPQQTPKAPVLIPGSSTVVWNGEGFNANATPWVIQTLPPVAGVGPLRSKFLANVTAASTLVIYVTYLGSGGSPWVDDDQANTYDLIGSFTDRGKTGYIFRAYNVAAGATTISAHPVSDIFRMSGFEVGGTPTTDPNDGFLQVGAGYGTTLGGSITTTHANDLIVGAVFNGMGRQATMNSPFVVKDFRTGGDSSTTFAGPVVSAGLQSIAATYSGGDNVLLQALALKPGTISTSPNVFSQQVTLPSLNPFPNYLEATVAFSGDPGAFEVDVQIADVDDPTQYVTATSITSGLNSNHVGNVQLTGVVGHYARLYMKSLANAVTCMATLSM